MKLKETLSAQLSALSMNAELVDASYIEVPKLR